MNLGYYLILVGMFLLIFTHLIREKTLTFRNISGYISSTLLIIIGVILILSNM